MSQLSLSSSSFMLYTSTLSICIQVNILCEISGIKKFERVCFFILNFDINLCIFNKLCMHGVLWLKTSVLEVSKETSSLVSSLRNFHSLS